MMAFRRPGRTLPRQDGSRPTHRLPSPPCSLFRRSADWPRPTWPPTSEQIALAVARRWPPCWRYADAAQTGYLQTAPDPALPAAVAARRRAGRPHAAPVADERRRVCARRELVPAGAALVRPVDPAAAGRAGFLPSAPSPTTWPPRAGALGGAGRAGRRQPLAGAGAQRSRPVRPPAARWSARSARPPPTRWRPRAVAAGRPAAGGTAGRRAPATATRRHIGREPSDGAAFVLRHPLLRPVLVTAVFFNVAWFVLQAVRGLCHPRPGAGRRRRGPDAGHLWPGHAAGALLAPRLARRLSRRADRRRPAARCWPAA